MIFLKAFKSLMSLLVFRHVNVLLCFFHNSLKIIFSFFSRQLLLFMHLWKRGLIVLSNVAVVFSVDASL